MQALSRVNIELQVIRKIGGERYLLLPARADSFHTEVQAIRNHFFGIYSAGYFITE